MTMFSDDNLALV